MKINFENNQIDLPKQSKSFVQFENKYSLKSFNNKKKKAFYNEFSTLIKSSVDYNRALELLQEQESSKKIQNIYQIINKKIIKGKSLHEALSEDENFSPYEIYSIKIGEETRRLPQVLDKLERYYEKKIKMKRQIISVMTYPSFVLLITFGVLYFMLTYVVPMFSSVFRQFGSKLPKITVYVQSISSNFNGVVLIALVVAAIVIALHFYLKKKVYYKKFIGQLFLKVPFLGKILKKTASAKFYQSMGLLLEAKTPLLDALKLCNEMISFYPLKNNINIIIMEVRKGSSLAISMEKRGFFEKKDVTILAIGEEVNKLDMMFNKLGDQLDEEIEHYSKTIGNILEPLMIIIIGSIVGFILIAMYYPMFSLSKVINN